MDRRVYFVEKYLETNFADKNDLTDLAKLVCLTPNYLHQLFKKEKEITIFEYLQNLRLNKSCELLEKSFYSVKEIAVIIGIKNQAVFCTVFKKQYGMTPTEYRKRSKIEIESQYEYMIANSRNV